MRRIERTSQFRRQVELQLVAVKNITTYEPKSPAYARL